MGNMGRYYSAGVVVGATNQPPPAGEIVSVPGGAPTPGPIGRTRALGALHLFLAEAGHVRWFGYAERGAGNPDVERFDQDVAVQDWYGTITDDPKVTYATYFDTQASTVEPAEEFAGTITMTPEKPALPAAQARAPESSNKAAIGVGLGLGVVTMIAIAKHK